MPLDVYKSKTLVSLKLVNVGLLKPEFVVSLPCLKIMHLEDIQYSDDDGSLIIQKLVSGCPVLEDLTLCRSFDDKLPVALRVMSQTLKRFCVKSGPGIESDAPGLKCIDFRDDDRVVGKNLSFFLMVDIDTKFNLHEFLNGVSSVRRSMIISQRTIKELYRCLNMEPISKFHNLSRLEVSFSSDLLLQVLPNFLEISPNLKYLTLCLVFSTKIERENLELANVPRCLLSTLECVEIKEMIAGEETGMARVRIAKTTAMKLAKQKKKIWMEVVRYHQEACYVHKTFSPVSNYLSLDDMLIWIVQPSFVQVRSITSKDKMAKWKKKWRPRTPITSKVKKVKIKFYSSYKDRFKPLNDGTIRRWKEGKRHNAHLKSKKSKRRLRQPGLVPPAYAKVMKKLNFCN
ncbi:hypothetical protein F2Q69_00055392 [Brassica cretica]|uniref:FBD domain-containing protein n=1 Tax=Brassica cretica TaxID=69181 RepID=A0A8S9MQP6_BRACR|nr:hypothetical protein F2Q69_00055392 [Brassica cretica]